eukprot:644145-Amphidinium_carterae.1
MEGHSTTMKSMEQTKISGQVRGLEILCADFEVQASGTVMEEEIRQCKRCHADCLLCCFALLFAASDF